MARVKSIQHYDGPEKKTRRLGLQPLVDGVASLVESTKIRVLEEVEANSAAAIRQMLDTGLAADGSWQSKKSGDVDSKCKIVNGRECASASRSRFPLEANTLQGHSSFEESSNGRRHRPRDHRSPKRPAA